MIKQEEEEEEQDKEDNDDNIESDIEYVNTLNENIIKYKQYHVHDVEKIELTNIYLNSSNQIQGVYKKEILLTQKNYISNQELVQLISSHSKYQNKRYHIFFLCKYNVIGDHNDNDNNDNLTLLSDISPMNDITFQPSIQLFHDLNEILFCYKESNHLQKTKKKQPINKIKTIIIQNHHSPHRHKKTRRK
jgi:hypothetical protein